MSVNGKLLGITRADCLVIAREFSIRDADAREIINQVIDAVNWWDERATGVNPRAISEGP